MAETVLTILKISVIVAILSSMFVLALKAGRPYLKELFGNPKLLLKYFLVMFILTPALALLFYSLDAAQHTVWMAVIVISISPSFPGMIKSISRLGGNAGLSTAWMITSIFISFIMIPVNLLIIEQILNVDIKIGIDAVIIKLMLMFIIPMLIGFMISRYRPKFVSFILEIVEMVSKIASVFMVICLLIIAVPMIIKSGIVEFSLILLFLIISLAISHFIESADRKHGPILSFSVITRLPAPAVILAGINGMTRVYAPTILTFMITGLILMAVYNKMFFVKKEPEAIAST